MEEMMKTINLKEYYPFFRQDFFIEVTDEVALVLLEDKSKEAAYQRKKYRYKAHYSLDCDDGIENSVFNQNLVPEQIVEMGYEHELLLLAVDMLPEKQAKRIYSHFILGLSISEISIEENISTRSIYESIQRGLNNLKTLL